MDIKTDILIIGSGIAGLYAALKISEKASVVLVTKKDSAESNTNLAQGGIASVMSQYDSFESHIKDTLIAGAGLCKKESVEIMVNEGPERIEDLIELGTKFTIKNGRLDLIKEGGHSANRIVHSADFTGKEVERALLSAVGERENITLLENHIAIDLITEHNVFGLKLEILNNRHCWGAYVLDVKSNVVKTIVSKVTILSTGGSGQIYLHTTNPKIATGDGFAMAYRAGATLGNMEFIQFHPTSLYSQSDITNSFKPSFLISKQCGVLAGYLEPKLGMNLWLSTIQERN